MQSDSRNVVLHYHLFKNAGTSVDRVLQNGFPNRWVTKEFPTAGGNNSQMIANWIQQESAANAFSTHSGVGPVPTIGGVNIVSVSFLRDPIERIQSVYRFERDQVATTMGAQLAKEKDLEGYIRHRLSIPGDRQCRNFQVNRLSKVVPGPGTELSRSVAALGELSFVGLVDDFANCMSRFSEILLSSMPEFKVTEPPHLNRSSGATELTTPYGLSEELLEVLLESNEDDFELLREVGSTSCHQSTADLPQN